MRQGVLDLRAFYASPLGAVTRQMISRKVAEAWSSVDGLDLLVMGYATPFVGTWAAGARRAVAAMPSAQGVEPWPTGAANRACLVDESALPLRNALFDRVLAVHALEESENPKALLREIWRVLAPSGRVILAVTARHGLWADADATPFGHGRPFSRRQLERLLGDADLAPVGWTRALYVPPVRWVSRWAEGFEQVGARLWPPFAGIILIEAMKTTFAVVPRSVKAGAVIRPALQPVPVGRTLAFGASPGQPSRSHVASDEEGTRS
jgi:SAM-dependent methyltransferase